MPLLSKQARRAQALSELDSLKSELDRWYQDWTDADTHEDGSPRGQYKTQLSAIHSEVNGTANILRDAVLNLDMSREAGTIYGEFARAERQILWIWRAWYFFRDKFQQRGDPRFGDILRAADEVEWSCHRPFFDLPSLDGTRMPAALPYVEPYFSPSALRMDQRQALDFKDSDFRLINEAFRELPVPIIKIPITAINNPWALVLIGHETGHIIEPLIESGFKLAFGEMLRQVIEGAAGSDNDQEAWQSWSDEIFADLYSVLTMGSWAVWAMIQFETAEPAVMLERRSRYPSPVVRLALLAALAKGQGLVADSLARPGTMPEDLTRDLSYVDCAADAITAMPQIQALRRALSFDPSAYSTKAIHGKAGEAEQWCRYLLSEGAEPTARRVRSARMAAAGTAQCWSETIFEENDLRDEETLGALRESAISKIIQAGPLGVRSSAPPKATAEPGIALFEVLKKVV